MLTTFPRTQAFKLAGFPTAQDVGRDFSPYIRWDRVHVEELQLAGTDHDFKPFANKLPRFVFGLVGAGYGHMWGVSRVPFGCHDRVPVLTSLLSEAEEGVRQNFSIRHLLLPVFAGENGPDSTTYFASHP